MSEYDLKLYKIIGEMLREVRLEKGFTLEQVADFVSVTPKTIQRYETGDRRIKIDTLMKMTKFFDLNYYEFMREAQTKNSGEMLAKEETAAYYLNDETRKIAQEIYDNKDMRMLFDAARKTKPDVLKSYARFLMDLQNKEEGSE